MNKKIVPLFCMIFCMILFVICASAEETAVLKVDPAEAKPGETI